MSVSSVAVSSLASSPQPPSPTASGVQDTAVVAGGIKKSPPQTAPAVKALLPPKVGQAIDISA
jgi:hypothetical protein